ncbi:MAG TPA: type II toxin-antitoxin system RelE/ParE family toxin [Verrucomicrobiae bacterium]|nr:type II toxin-antitoxin system RelE/ParE family toxin [Verrucomicrobiae bacterium]
MRVVSHPEADEELEAAALWYDERQSGLGDDFLDQFERTLRRIVAEPERWRKIRGDNRKLNFLRFPYAIVYSIRVGHIYVKAVMHLHRRPSYWKGRV